jgi:hypothetical protein
LEWPPRPLAARLPATALSVTRRARAATNAPAFNSAVGAVNINDLAPAQNARVARRRDHESGHQRRRTRRRRHAAGSRERLPGDLASAFNFATNEATKAGKLGGHGDQLFNSNLAEQNSARQIGVGNSNAENLKSLLPTEQDIAQAESYKPSSAAACSAATRAARAPAPTALSCPSAPAALFARTPSSMLGPYSGGD